MKKTDAQKIVDLLESVDLHITKWLTPDGPDAEETLRDIIPLLDGPARREVNAILQTKLQEDASL